MKKFKLFLRKFGLDFLAGILLFWVSHEFFKDHSLDQFFHVDSALFGAISFFGIWFIINGFINLFCFFSNRKKADINNSVKE